VFTPGDRRAQGLLLGASGAAVPFRRHEKAPGPGGGGGLGRPC